MEQICTDSLEPNQSFSTTHPHASRGRRALESWRLFDATILKWMAMELRVPLSIYD